MSLNINAAEVSRVLLADRWHIVQDHSFNCDSYEFVDDGEIIHGGGNSGVCATGFAFVEQGAPGTPDIWIRGPLTAVLAVATDVDE